MGDKFIRIKYLSNVYKKAPIRLVPNGETVKDYPPYLDYPKPRKKQTNADRIRAMTDEDEMAMFILQLYRKATGYTSTMDGLVELLKQDVPCDIQPEKG